jgi:multicomponent Na+:H+ antiporter subunit G
VALTSAYGASVLSTVAWDAASVGTWVADVLIVLGILVMTIGVYGVVRMPDTYTRLHVASKMVFLGAMPLLLASALVGGQDVALRVILIAFFILLTTPVSAHMVGRAAYLRGERIKSPEPVEEETNRDF